MRTENLPIRIGQRLPGWTRPRPEGGTFVFDAGGARLSLGYDRPRPDEITSFRDHPIRIGLARADRHTSFFLFDIEGCTDGWADAPYALGMVHPADRQMPPRQSEGGRVVMLCLHDALSGMVHMVRSVSMSAAFASVLDTLLAEQRAALAAFNRDQYNATIDRAYACWRLPADIARTALITETAGAGIEQTPTETPWWH